MTQKTFVLGIGAPKSGTTWLYRYIDGLAVSNMGCRKEYRVLPGMFSDAPLRSRFNFHRLFQLKYGVLPLLDPAQFVRLRMVTQDGFYERYFADLVDDDVWLTGDISPGYMAMPADQLRSAADRLRGVGFKVKVIFLMRDPVERCWSGGRMRKRNRTPGFIDISDEEAVRQIYRSQDVTKLTRYDKTLAVLGEAFAPEDVFVSLFEELFSETQMDCLADFLGVEPQYEKLGQVFNKTHRTGELPPELVDEIKAYFAPVYAACHDQFPQTRELWL